MALTGGIKEVKRVRFEVRACHRPTFIVNFVQNQHHGCMRIGCHAQVAKFPPFFLPNENSRVKPTRFKKYLDFYGTHKNINSK